MRVVILDTPEAVAHFSANVIVQQLLENPNSVFGLATGSTPLLLYRELIKHYQRKTVSFKSAMTFNLDEYIGLGHLHPQSYRHFMDHHLFQHIDIDPKNTHIPNGNAADIKTECMDYESKILAVGGIDLQLLGIGGNGHIGFNEPSSSLGSRTRVKTLNEQTLKDNARFFSANEFQPHLAITMGIGTIMESRKILLLATGAPKAEAIRQTVEGPISAFCPASAIQYHTDATIVVDEAAARELQYKDYYRHTERMRDKV